MIHVAFYDEQQRRLVAHELVSESRQSAGFTAIMLGLLWKSGRHSLPSRYWVVWQELDDLGVFLLDQIDADEPIFPTEAMLDHIAECARLVTKASPGRKGVKVSH